MQVINKQHLFFLLNIIGLVSGLFVPITASFIKLPKKDAAAAQALAELKHDFAEQQKIMMRMRANIVEQYIQYGQQHIEFSKEQIAQNQYAALKELNSIDVQVCDDHLEIWYEIHPKVLALSNNSPAELVQELLARPYGALVLPMTIALRKSALTFAVKQLLLSSHERISHKSVKLDEHGNTAELFFDTAFIKIRSRGPHVFGCKATVPLTKTQKKTIEVYNAQGSEAALTYIKENCDTFVANE